MKAGRRIGVLVRLWASLGREQGQTLAEYALLGSLVTVFCVAGASALANSLRVQFEAIGTALSSATGTATEAGSTAASASDAATMAEATSTEPATTETTTTQATSTEATTTVATTTTQTTTTTPTTTTTATTTTTTGTTTTRHGRHGH